jgi:acetyl-CoA C-acetyltransferase
MTLPPRTPVLVGAAAVQQHRGAEGDEAVGLMIEAMRRAGDDSGNPALPGQADLVTVPRGTWGYADPARLVSAAVGANARTVLAQLGVLQQTLLTRACAAIAAGQADVVAVCGGEARDRSRLILRAGQGDHERADAGATPDEVLVPDGDIIDPLELQCGLAVPAHQYAMMENALRASDGQRLDEHADAIARLWAAFSRVASANPDAWSGTSVAPEELTRPSQRNRLIAFPYNRLHVSQWNVNQAAALIFASAEAAERLGISSDRWVFPLAAAESNTMVPLVRRKDLHRCPGVTAAGNRALELGGVGLDDIRYIDLYSCFPAAVRIQARELGLRDLDDRALTITGGMTFAGGPLNNYVLQATVKTAELLRAAGPEGPGSATIGLVSTVSGMLTKQAFALWSNRPPEPARGFTQADVSEETRRRTPTCAVTPGSDGPATVASYTVTGGPEDTPRCIVLADLPDGSRTIATSADEHLAREMTTAEWCGRRIDTRGATIHI